MNLKKWMSYIFLTIFIFLTAVNILYAITIAKTSISRDFAAFYCAGSIVIDPSLRDEAVYNPSIMEKVAIVHGLDVRPEEYHYAVPIAYLFSPLTLLPYENAKEVFLFISLLSYFSANIIILKIMQPAGKWLPFFAIIPWMWLPFIINQYWIQTNSILLLWIALGVYLAVKKKDLLAGFLFGIAILMKVFPLILVLLIGIKNWRILVSSLATVSLFLVFPAAITWIEVLRHDNHPNYTPIARWFIDLGPFWMLAYQGILFSLSALIVYRFKSRDYLLITALGVVSSLLISPVVGGYYYTLLILCFAYLYSVKEMLPIWMKLIGLIPFVIFGFTVDNGILNIFGLFLLWFTLVFIIYQQDAYKVREEINGGIQEDFINLCHKQITDFFVSVRRSIR
jgi:hypothetical protein